jgi:hypothetical protein
MGYFAHERAHACTRAGVAREGKCPKTPLFPRDIMYHEWKSHSGFTVPLFFQRRKYFKIPSYQSTGHTLGTLLRRTF